MWNISCNGGNFGRRGTRSCFFSIDWIEIYARWNWIETIRIPDQNAINHQPLGSDELAFLISTWIDLILRSNGFVLHRFCTEKTGFISSENFLNFPPRLYRVEFFSLLKLNYFIFFCCNDNSNICRLLVINVGKIYILSFYVLMLSIRQANKKDTLFLPS